ncbi:hypothetical protein PIROE2DRAFT_13117 [Piromyces sp. E2]|nr:hypothetical protein PIROE2DRAFT_13117 [Piromyces sp. E2]|eukprot:OUM61002.1 hypothetical protein PIROE2DRAFT_13117 [Piromyces sp. E2]
MKYTKILSFIASIAFAYGAVIPNDYEDSELSVNEDLINNENIDAEGVSEIVISSEEENEVVETDGNNVEVVLSEEENIEVEVSNEESVEVEDSDEENIKENTTNVVPIVEPTSTIESIVEPTSTVAPVIEPTSTIESVVEPTSTVAPVIETTSTIEPDVEPTSTIVEKPTESPLKLTPGPVTCTYKKKDTDTKYDEKSDNQISCKGTTCTVKGNGVKVSEGIVTITAAGNYILQGELHGQVRIEANEKDFIHLILNDVHIKSEEGPAVAVLSAEKVTLTLVGQNKLTDSENYIIKNDKEPDACLYAKTDLSINGEGNLDISAKFGTAVHCTKDLKLVTGNVTILEAKEKGIQAKNSICIHDANVEINSINSALKVTNKTKGDKGFVVIENGNITLSTENDAIHGETHVTIYDGFIDIKKCNEGIEAQMIDVLGGEIHILTKNDGINVSKVSKEKKERGPPPPPPDFNDPNGLPPMPNFGPEVNDGSMYANIVGGKLYITAKDDMNIDGIDSNGILYVGGNAEIYVNLEYGKIYGDFAALDSDGDNVVSGKATIVAAAAKLSWEDAAKFLSEEEKKNRPPPPPPPARDRGMVYQQFIKISEMPKQPEHTEIVLKDKNGTIITSYAPECSYDTIFIVSPKLVAGESYELTAGSYSTTVTPSEGDEGEYKSPSVDGF